MQNFKCLEFLFLTSWKLAGSEQCALGRTETDFLNESSSPSKQMSKPVVKYVAEYLKCQRRCTSRG